MSILRSRPLKNLGSGLESLQISSSLTFAEESLRKALNYINGDTTWLHREIIVPQKKVNKPLLRDESGYMLRGYLADRIGRNHWDKLSDKQKEHVSLAGSLAYRAEHDEPFEMRTVFFRGLISVVLDESSSNAFQQRYVIAVVKIHAQSGCWDLAEVRAWQKDAGSHQYELNKVSILNNSISLDCPVEVSAPPKFLTEK